jgi:hypothetical protein
VQPDVGRAIARLDSWLESMRGRYGYTGPISHWWESSLTYCGPMADWRYEGIVCGYLSLYRSTCRSVWLERALRAGDDLVEAQTPTGNFRRSGFQLGPIEGGTPHEAAADVALLELATQLRDAGDLRWSRYFDTARRNIDRYLIPRLWNGTGFRDQPGDETLVPNKNATVIEALILFERLSGSDMSRYIDPALDVILSAQQVAGPRAGATIHLGTGRHRLAIGIYTARSMCGLLRSYERSPTDRLLDSAAAAIVFLRGLQTPEGSYFGRYLDGTLIANPRLIAGVGDILRLFAWGAILGIASPDDVNDLAAQLIAAQSATGAIPTGFGFARRGRSVAYRGIPEFRDVLPVAGWCDKAFRAFSYIAGADVVPSAAALPRVEIECTWDGRRHTFVEDGSRFELYDRRSERPVYRWRKGSCYPEVYEL